MKYPVIAVKSGISKAGNEYFQPTCVLPDGDTFQTFSKSPVKVGEELSFRVAKFTVDDGMVGRSILMLIPEHK